MALEQILSVSGKSGLFRLVGQMKNGIIVESIADGKRFPVHGAAKVSALEEISIYTDEEEIALKDVFKAIYEKEGGKQTVSAKESNDKIKALFEEVVPNYDKERVYTSDMVKVVRWYNELIENEAYDPNAEEESSDEEGGDAAAEAKATKTKAPKKPSTKGPAKSAGKKPTTGGKVTAPRKSGGAQRGG